MARILDTILWNEIVNNIGDAREEIEVRREILPQRNPFLLTEKKFIKLFRLSKELCLELINIVTPYMIPPSRASAITIQTKVLVTLRFLGYGSYQEITGSNHYVGLSQASVSRAITEVCNVLNMPQIFNTFVKYPSNLEEIERLRARYFRKYAFPGIIGCVDCTHVAIIAPTINNEIFPEHIFVNRKNYHSLNVQIVCDENLTIMNINAKFPGSSHDSNIWRNSRVSEVMENIYRNNPQNNFFLIGDSGYPTRPWLLTPIRNPTPGPEERFNNRFCHIRSLVERCNGLLKNRFRCLLRHRVLHYSPSTAGKMVNSCAVLHNMCVAQNLPEPEPESDSDEEIDYGMYDVEEENNIEVVGAVNPDLEAARRLQRTIINHHFT